MAEIVASAVVSETLSRVSSFLIDKYRDRRSTERDDDTERLEMAHIRMEAALEASGKWPPATDVPLLRWRNKLKRAADECDAVLRRCKRGTVEDQGTRQCPSFPARIAHATRSFFSSTSSSPSGHNDGEPSIDCSEAVVRRYERFADGASEFLRFLEHGSVRRQMLILDPLAGHLLAGRAFQYEVSQGSRRYYFAGRPMSSLERGLEGGVLLRCRDHEAPEHNFVLGILMRLTESTDMAAVVAECLGSRLLAPHLKPVADAATQELDRVHTRGMYCYPFLASTDPVYWNIHLSETRRARPEPLCCKGGHDHKNSMTRLPGAFPEPVIKLFVQRHVSARERRQSRRRKKEKISLSAVVGNGLQLTTVFAPHASTEELPSGVESIAVEVVDGSRDEQVLHENVGLHQLEELLLPGATRRLCHGAAAAQLSQPAREVFWRSGHGVAYLCVEKSGTDMAMCRATQWQF
ncbi:unnamed protein product [Triticum turgidum subsp. durum]|uniref:Uncharacterized protein n=1 Tax=Triticum turgidum subsp. durum TaxID=4567 RepID=A0A9R1NX12_TRITD|nr:unnamed protein product [Triticum turgidum subsp. durum]